MDERTVGMLVVERVGRKVVQMGFSLAGKKAASRVVARAGQLAAWWAGWRAAWLVECWVAMRVACWAVSLGSRKAGHWAASRV